MTRCSVVKETGALKGDSVAPKFGGRGEWVRVSAHTIYYK